MWHTLHKNTLSVWALILVVVVGCLLSVNCFADNGDAVIKEFKEPPVFNSREMNLENIEEKIYRAIGVVDAINDKAIAIGDVQYNLEPGVRITCRAGSFVGIKVNDRGNVIACEPLRLRR